MKFSKIKIFLILTFLPFVACCGESSKGKEEKGGRSASISGADSICVSEIRKYVEKTRKWDEEDYSLIQENSSPGLRGFSVMHKDDVGALLPGRGVKSFHVDLDKGCQRILKELAYQ